MAEEIIKLIEYIMGNPVVQGLLIASVSLVTIVFITIIAVYVFTFRTIINNRKRWK